MYAVSRCMRNDSSSPLGSKEQAIAKSAVLTKANTIFLGARSANGHWGCRIVDVSFSCKAESRLARTSKSPRPTLLP